MKKNVLITGGKGFIGKNLTQLLIEKGYTVSILSRNIYQNTPNITYYRWDIDKGFMDEKSVLEADYIVNLAGEGIADQRWTTARKTAIVDSRVEAIKLIYDVLKKHNKKTDAFISASGVGFYGAFTSKKIYEESASPANDFLGDTCQKWEAAADLMTTLGIRTVKIRTGLVLGRNEGFLKKLVPIFKLRLGSVIGSGQQYMPWIHIEDLCSMYLFAIENEKINGAYNAAIRDGVTNAVFSNELAKRLGYKIWLPAIPEFFIRLVLGEMSAIVLTGQRVSSCKIQNAGFVFKYEKLDNALRYCLRKSKTE